LLLRDIFNAITDTLKALVEFDADQNLVALICEFECLHGSVLDRRKVLQARFYLWHVKASIV